MRFNAPILKFEKGLWSYHVIVPDDIYLALTKDGNKRVICSINNKEEFHAGLMPDGKGQWFIMLNKEKMKTFELNLGEVVTLSVVKDNSKYGMKVSKEFEEVLSQDSEGKRFFEKLTSGKKRNLIYIIEKVKSSDKRITKSLVILNHLKSNNGKLDFKMLNQALKENNY